MLGVHGTRFVSTSLLQASFDLQMLRKERCCLGGVDRAEHGIQRDGWSWGVTRSVTRNRMDGLSESNGLRRSSLCCWRCLLDPCGPRVRRPYRLMPRSWGGQCIVFMRVHMDDELFRSTLCVGCRRMDCSDASCYTMCSSSWCGYTYGEWYDLGKLIGRQMFELE